LGTRKDKPLSTRGQRGVPSTRKLTRSHLSSFCRDSQVAIKILF
jgi:hypothetical protein